MTKVFKVSFHYPDINKYMILIWFRLEKVDSSRPLAREHARKFIPGPISMAAHVNALCSAKGRHYRALYVPVSDLEHAFLELGHGLRNDRTMRRTIGGEKRARFYDERRKGDGRAGGKTTANRRRARRIRLAVCLSNRGILAARRERRDFSRSPLARS